MELRDLCCINRQAFFDKVKVVLKRKGVADEDELTWYLCFLKSALLYLEQQCRFEDFSFDSLIKLCKETKPYDDMSYTVYDVLLEDWMNQSAYIVKDYNIAKDNKIPEDPVTVLEEVFEEMKKQDVGEYRFAKIKEADLKPGLVPEYVQTIHVVKDSETGERYFIYEDVESKEELQQE